ncbi:MAG: T9SS type A sorting domain-containing protein [bacterium]|nr:T9SS type A sorting domain-containing protein [bacterium]MCP4799472.1 T9SS type A sorting domain-containing protein [bacterium]
MKFSILVLALLCMIVSVSSADIRVSEPGIISGSELAVFDGAPVGDLHLFAFIGGFWYELPVQIDERSVSGSFFEADDGLLDGNDEVIFQPQDFGDLAPTSAWIDDVDSQNYPRLKLSVADPVLGSTTIGYLYRSSTLPDNPDSYINYDDIADEIMTDTYMVGFDNNDWFWDELRLFDGNVYGADLMDREKTRIKGTILWTNWTRNEQDFSPILKRYVGGPVRVIRETRLTIEVLGITSESTMTKHYYDSFMVTPEDIATIDPLAGINMVRLSYDLTPEAIGSVESNLNNATLLADGVPDGANTNIPSSEMSHFWIKINLNGSSLVSVGNQYGISSSNVLYHHDDSSGGTADGTSDTGDGASYGDIGIRMNNPASGSHSTSASMYMALGTDLSGIDCQSWFDTGFNYDVASEDYDNTSAVDTPVIIASNLRNIPNPFNPLTEIQFQLADNCNVELTIYDATGRMVNVLYSGSLASGQQSFTWNGNDQLGQAVSSGTYFARLHGQNIDLVKSMSLVR